MKTHTPLTRPAVLLVEDTLSLQMVYRSILATSGHRVAVAATAADGLEQFRTHRPMVVLLDLILPDRDGLEVMQEIQAIQPETRVIAITANQNVVTDLTKEAIITDTAVQSVVTFVAL